MAQSQFTLPATHYWTEPASHTEYTCTTSIQKWLYICDGVRLITFEKLAAKATNIENTIVNRLASRSKSNKKATEKKRRTNDDDSLEVQAKAGIHDGCQSSSKSCSKSRYKSRLEEEIIAQYWLI